MKHAKGSGLRPSELRAKRRAENKKRRLKQRRRLDRALVELRKMRPPVVPVVHEPMPSQLKERSGEGAQRLRAAMKDRLAREQKERLLKRDSRELQGWRP